jgi:hypothetical protein
VFMVILRCKCVFSDRYPTPFCMHCKRNIKAQDLNVLIYR